jgi:hypothetical protein
LKYLFLAVPPFSGSTVLHNYIAKCSGVAALTNEFTGLDIELADDNSAHRIGLVEGNYATEARVFYKDIVELSDQVLPGSIINKIQNLNNYDWVNIKKYWDNNWLQSNPDAIIRLQKTPNDTYRVQMMQQYFDANWIIMVRNPYAYAQSIIEKLLVRDINPSSRAEEIVSHIVNTYSIQKENKAFLKDKSYVVTFEEFVKNEDIHTLGLKRWMPELSDLSFKGPCFIKFNNVDGLKDNNDTRIEIFKKIPGALNKFNNLFKPHECLFNSWGYELI